MIKYYEKAKNIDSKIPAISTDSDKKGVSQYILSVGKSSGGRVFIYFRWLYSAPNAINEPIRTNIIPNPLDNI